MRHISAVWPNVSDAEISSTGWCPSGTCGTEGFHQPLMIITQTSYFLWDHERKISNIIHSVFINHFQHFIILIAYLGPWQLPRNCPAAKSCPALCSPTDCSTPGSPVPQCLPEFAQAHVQWVSDAIQPSRPASAPSPPALNLSQYQGLFQWVSSSHQVARVLELYHQSFQWIFSLDFF